MGCENFSSSGCADAMLELPPRHTTAKTKELGYTPKYIDFTELSNLSHSPKNH